MKNFDELKKVVEQEISASVDSDKVDISFDTKIFQHSDEERRVTYEHIKSFYRAAKKEAFDPEKFIYYFGHALKGKDEEIYRTPVSFDIDNVKQEVMKKIDLKSLGPNQGKKVKQLKKIIEEKYINLFQRTHFHIRPITRKALEQICKDKGFDIKKLDLNETSGMVSNACMSDKCKYFLQPLKKDEFMDHMRLWKKTLPPSFHYNVAVHLRSKKTVE